MYFPLNILVIFFTLRYYVIFSIVRKWYFRTWVSPSGVSAMLRPFIIYFTNRLYIFRFMSIIVKSLSYIHPDKSPLFSAISFSVAKGTKASLVGNNGTGKSTLLNLIAGTLPLSGGEVFVSGKPYYIPQHLGQYDTYTIAGALGVQQKIEALHAILQGDASAENFALLGDEWDIEERCNRALSLWGLEDFSLSQSVGCLSGGEKTKVFLSGIMIYDAPVVLLDEPSNHLDRESRTLLYDFIHKSKSTVLVVSHDRALLDLAEITFELTQDAIEAFGGNYTFYKAEKERKLLALQSRLEAKENTLKLARQRARDIAVQRNKQEVRGRQQGEKKGLPRIVMNALQSKAEQNSSRMKEIQNDRIEGVSQDIREIKEQIKQQEILKIALQSPDLYKGKVLVKAADILFAYGERKLWKNPLSFTILSGERICIEGCNGSGKTTLVKILTNQLQPFQGEIFRAEFSYLYIDQEYSLINNALSVLEQALQCNDRNLSESEVKTLLHRHQFTREVWDRSCALLSGGEKMKLILCCVTLRNNAPDMIILDEPTNNIDVHSQEILTAAVKNFSGTLILISHDITFRNEIAIGKKITLF